jgi:AcrR family transcriptional regulator
VTNTIRLTQAERVAAMRGRLLDAAIECLTETGYGGFSTNDVVRRAGVSRGALAHHFPTKAGLVAAAADRLVELRAEEFRARFEAIAPERRTVARALDVLWTFFEDPSYQALLELMVAARSDDELRPVMAAGLKHAAEVTREVFAESFPDMGELPFIGETLDAILAVYSGLAAQVALDADADGRHAAVRALLKGALTLAADTRPHDLLAQPRPSQPGPSRPRRAEPTRTEPIRRKSR